jgi:hypothetical protein
MLDFHGPYESFRGFLALFCDLLLIIITAMTEIKEVNALGTIASIRKATQESLKPVIEEYKYRQIGSKGKW